MLEVVLRVQGLAVGCLFGLSASIVGAQVPVSAEILAEPTEYTDVLDAFEPEDPFDIRISWGYRASTTTGTIQRETTQRARGQGNYIDVAQSEYATKTLSLDVEVGVYRDLMVFFQLPFVLEHERMLRLPSDARGEQSLQRDAVEAALNEPLPVDGQSEIFLLDNGLRSQLRDGIPSVNFGLAWSVFNQYRARDIPTWTLRLATEVGTGAVMSPCLADGACSRGVSRGTIKTELGSRWSYRYRLLEPYLGVAYAHQFVGTGEDNFTPAGDLLGDVDAGPPAELTLTSGLAVIPWENRGRFQRLSVDARLAATHVTRGRDYSPLFDALGTSGSPYLTTPNFEVPTGQGKEVPFTGMTQVDSHARIAAQLTLLIQAARYVRFKLGVGLAYLTPHLLTGASPCRVDVQAGADDPRAGDCTAGISNPSYRAVIDQPGKRFRLDGSVTLDVSAAASGQF